MKIKILHVDTGRDWRGGQNQIYKLISVLKDKPGVEQILACPENSPLAAKLRKLGVLVFAFDPANDLDILSALRLKKLIKSESPDVVHMHSARALGIASWTGSDKNIKKIFTKRVDFPMRKGIFFKYKYNYPDKIVAISDFIISQLEAEGFKGIEKIYSSVDMENFSRNNISDKAVLRVAMAGALDLKHKDFDTYLSAIKQLLINSPDIGNKLRFVIAGDGKDKLLVQQKIEDYALSENVEMLGFIEDMPRFFSDIDILVHAAHYEGLGTVILQSMSSGVPVIATEVGGIPEMIKHNENGILVEIHNANMLAEKIKELSANYAKRQEISDNAYVVIKEKFSKQIMADKYLRLYEPFKN